MTKLIGSIAVCHLAGLIGSVFTTPNIQTWYATLEKPTFSPPNWLFAPVWLTLYTLMGIALYLIWQKGLKNENNRFAFFFFLLHLFFNAIWSIIFFGLHSPLLAFFVIVILWLMIIIMIMQFSRIRKWAGYLLAPYLLWVSFAGVLNFAIWWLNRG